MFGFGRSLPRCACDSAGSSRSRVNLKAGITPNAPDEYSINYTRQEGEKGGLLNVYNTPQVPPNSFWRWPRWDVQTPPLDLNDELSWGLPQQGQKFYAKVRANF